MFVGRTQEVQHLKAVFNDRRGSLVIVYGRRRVGKSRLLQQAADGHPLVFFQASRETAYLNLDAFKSTIQGALGGDPTLSSLADWQGVLHWLADAARRRHGLVVVLDEFSYLCDADPAIPSIIQKVWDSGAPREGGLNLVLCGSVVSAMEAILAERNPLYGRQSAVLDVQPLPLTEAAMFFPDYTAEQQVVMHAVFGGIPYYLEACDPAQPPERNIQVLLLAANGRFVDEPVHLMQSELAEPKVYASIVHAMADGCTKLNDIKQRVFGDNSKSSISAYMDRLASMRIIAGRRSLDADPRARNTRYEIIDPLVAFWNRFVRPNMSAITLGHGEDVYKYQVEPHLSAYLGTAFEQICRDHVARHGKELFGVPAQKVGAIWTANFDIDVAAVLLDRSVALGECKWWTDPVGENVLDRLVERSDEVALDRQARRYFVLFSRGGFSDDLQRRAERDDVALLGPEDLVHP